MDPPEGEIPAATAAGGVGSVIITAVVTVESSGALSGDINVQIPGSEEPKRLTFSATGVKHTFDLLESSGVIINEVGLGRGGICDLSSSMRWGERWAVVGGEKLNNQHRT